MDIAIKNNNMHENLQILLRQYYLQSYTCISRYTFR